MDEESYYTRSNYLSNRRTVKSTSDSSKSRLLDQKQPGERPPNAGKQDNFNIEGASATTRTTHKVARTEPATSIARTLTESAFYQDISTASTRTTTVLEAQSNMKDQTIDNVLRWRNATTGREGLAPPASRTLSTQPVTSPGRSPNRTIYNRSPIIKSVSHNIISATSVGHLKQPTIRRYRLIRHHTEFDMSNLPYIPYLRRTMALLCFLTFCVSPVVYFPLAEIQHLQPQTFNCFLNANILVFRKSPDDKKYLDASENQDDKDDKQAKDQEENIYGFDPLRTEWGEDLHCKMTTFTPVSIQILSVILGFATLQIWPELMAAHQGGALAFLYFVVTLPFLVMNLVSAHYLSWGVNATCNNVSLKIDDTIDREKLTCANITKKLRYIEQPNIHHNSTMDDWMDYVMIGGSMLSGLLLFKLIISLMVFYVIVYYYHKVPHSDTTDRQKDRRKSH